MSELKDFTLPNPDTRIVLFGKKILKIKYRFRGPISCKDEALCKSCWFNSELQKVTKAILTQVTRKGQLIPCRSDRLAVYPESHLWESWSDLIFSIDGEELEVHPNVILLLVRPIVFPDALFSSPLKPNQLLPVKRMLPPLDERLPSENACHLIRKKLRVDDELSSGPSAAGIPTEDSTAYPTGAQTAITNRRPSVDTVTSSAAKVMESFHKLSQPTHLKELKKNTIWETLRSYF